MFRPYLLKTVARKMSLALALAMSLQPLLQPDAIGAKAIAHAAVSNLGNITSALHTSANTEIAASLQSGGTQNQPLDTAQALFDQVVRQAFKSQQWQVAVLHNSLNWDTVQKNDRGLAGSGRWQVEGLDEKGQSARIEGDLSFDIEGDEQTSSGLAQIVGADTLASSMSVFTGTFRNDNAALDFTARMSTNGSTGEGTVATEARSDVSLTHNGATTKVTNLSTGKVARPAYGVTQTTSKGTLERDGKTQEWTQTTTVRDFGKGESEVWEEMETSHGDPASPGKLEQHSFQRIAGTALSQYTDRFNLTTGGKSYKLDKPGSVTGTMNGDFNSNLVLVDGTGSRIELNTPKRGARPPGLSSPMRQGIGIAGSGGGGLSSDQASAILYVVGAGLLIVGTGGLAAILLGGAGAAAAAAEAAAIAGAGAAVGAASGGIVAASNADPYFVLADTRPGYDPIGASPLQITRMTGGLMSLPPVLPVGTSTNVTGTVDASAGAEAVYAAASPQDEPLYDDDPIPFVGGSLPKGAQPVGEWAWDRTRMYGAIPTHTQSRADGPQMHYFTHATNPLKLGTDSNIIQYVYIDPADAPAELFMQFYTGKGDGEHRAYWGQDRVQTGGTGGTASLYPMGAMPATGGWVRLQIPAGKLGLVGGEINGILFGLYSGKVWWGPTTTSNRLLDNAPDAETVQAPPQVATTTLGTQIAYRLAEPMHLSIEIVDAQGKPIRTLQNSQEEAGGYHVAVWDAKDDKGELVQDAPFSVRFISDGNTVAEQAITVTPFVAHILTPSPYSLVRGDQVPVIAEAYGEGFSSYTLEYGAGISPVTWTTLTVSESPTLIPTGRELKQFNPGNLANWNVGVNEFKPWNQEGLNGVYTLRLRVDGKDGRKATDTTTVIVGRLAHTAEGGTISSPDGKARLTIPALATTSPFSLMSLVPASQLQPGDSWRGNLPANANLVGDVYEVFPAGERFRRPATLELPYSGGEDPARLGVMLGNGTRDGWRYIGGKYDGQKGVVTVPITGFGGGRAMLALVTKDNFGPPPTDPTANAHLQIAQADQAPFIKSAGASNSQVAFYSDLESSPGEWEALDISGTQLTRAKGPDAGVKSGDSVLKVTHRVGGVRLVRVRSTPYDAAGYPIISFDYRLPDDYTPDLFVRSSGVWWQLKMGSGAPIDTPYFRSLDALKLVGDGSWHHYSADLLALLQSADPQASNFKVDEIVLGQFEKTAYMQVAAVDSGEIGSSYYIDNFAALTPTNATSLHITWTPPPGVSFSAYASALDANNSFSPTESNQGAATGTDVSLPAAIADGLYYFHLSGRGADGAWSAATDMPILLDRTAPTVDTATSLLNGATSASALQLPLFDATGVAPSSLRLRLGGQTYGVGSGLTYDPVLGSIEITPASLKPPLTFNSNQQVKLTLLSASDHAGNKLSAPFNWRFTTDNSRAGDAKFRQLTVRGGSSPALSPDGVTLAFVSVRSGAEKIWLMQAADFGEKAAGAKPLTGIGGASRETDPAWSTDGQTLAFVSNASGSPQLWLTSADGRGARSITTGEGGAASPTWLPDGGSIVFVRDGNLWSVKPDGSELQPVTTYPERPIRSVRAQPQPGGQLLAVGFKLYQETVEIYDMATGELRPLTEGGRDREPAWLNGGTVLFTAPAGKQNGGEQQDALWQVNAYEGIPEPLPDSALQGVSDSQPSTEVGGQTAQQNLLAIVSNRGGESNIWARQSEQIGWLDVTPPAGATPGQGIKLSYVLPSTVTVTLRVESANGALVQSLLADVSQEAGPHEAEWDGKDASGTEAPEGSYTVSLSAKTAGGTTLTRYATARRISATGTLQLSIEQWAGQPVGSDTSLRVTVYPAGTRTRPSSLIEGNSNPSFDLPPGRYDLVVEYKNFRHEENGIAVEVGKPSQLSVDLGLGSLQPALLLAQGQPLSASAYIAVSRAGDPNGLPLQTRYATNPDFALPPGRYDVRVEYGSIQITARDVQVRRAEVAQPEINLNSGLLSLQVYARDGELAEAGGRLLVEAVDPRDHSKVISVAYRSNPVDLPLPAGSYDIRVDYGTAASGQEGVVSGNVTSWITGLTVQSGQTITREYNLKLTPVTISVLEAQGKHAPTGALSFQVFASGKFDSSIASALTDTAHLELPEGTFSVVADYRGTELKKAGPVGDPIAVKYGQQIDRTINLGLGHISVEVRDEQGQLSAANDLAASAYRAGQRDIWFATAFEANPLDLAVRAGNPYDIVLQLGDGRTLTLAGQRVGEGSVLTLKVARQDYK